MSCAASGLGSWGMASKMPRVHSPKNWRKPSTSAVKHSTGPKSEEGKARVSRNPYKGGTRARLRELARLLREQAEALKRIG
jgi:hypothetical protein